MEKEFIPYDQALEMKKLGFKEVTLAGYDNDTRELYIGYDTVCGRTFNPEYHSPAPLYQQAFRWFRDQGFLIDFSSHDKNIHDFYIRWAPNKSILSNDYPTFDEMELECLKQLIQIANK